MVPGKKGEGVTRVLYENANGLSSRLTGNEKLDKAKDYINDLGADVVAYNEHRLNMKHKKNRHGLRQMFQGGEADLRTVVGYNTREDEDDPRSPVQEGGTALIATGPVTQHVVPDESGADALGLGRWSSMMLQGSDGIRTRIVVGYNPCSNNRPDSGTVYQQHRRFYINKQSDLTCPRKRFLDDFGTQLRKWRNDGERLIVALDANQHIYRGALGKMLTDDEDLRLVEAVGSFTGRPLGATFFRGTAPIDGVWCSPDIQIVGASLMPVGYGIGDHRLFVVDFLTRSLLGATPPKVLLPAARRLNTRIPGCAERYTASLQPNLERHRLVDRLHIANGIEDGAEAQRQMDAIDEDDNQYRRHAEAKCRNIRLGRIPFSPDSAVWIRRSQVYRSLLKFHAAPPAPRRRFRCRKGKRIVRRKGQNRANLKRTARRCGIEQPFTLTVEEILARLEVCKSKMDYFRKHGKYYRRRHLYNRLQAAQERKDEEAEKRILEIIKREKDRAFWRRLNYALGKHARAGSVRTVQSVNAAGQTIEHATQDSVEQAIFDEVHRKRYNMAEEAPVCRGRLRGQFGYCSSTIAGEQVLDGTYADGSSVDAATQAIFDEIAALRKLIPKDSVPVLIEGQQWRDRWRSAKEDTSSSESGIHFGHYRASAIIDTREAWWLCHYDAMKASLALKKGLYYSRYSRGLSVMLEKETGVRLVSRLRAILLMEADFNSVNKIIYGDRMLANMRQHRLMSEEIFSERNKEAEDGGLAKVLFYDVVRQARVSAAIASVDASNCYDRIAHAIASLVFRACGVPTSAVKSMLEAIQNMKFFLRTAFGDSTSFAGSTLGVKTQGLCQGNGAAPAGWAVISVVIIRAHKNKGHGATFHAPISGTRMGLAGILFVDDTDLLHVDLSASETITDAHEAMQSGVTDWGNLLIATGGALKPDKCFHTLIGFEWVRGKWRYVHYDDNPDADLLVPLPDGSQVPIAHVPITEARETLGIFSAPDGNSTAAIKRMQSKTDSWLARAQESRLYKRMLIHSVERQLWPSVRYGLCCNLGSLKDLDAALYSRFRHIAPLTGIASTAKVGIRTLGIGFYGAGLPHPGIEAAVAQLQKLQMHYGCNTSVGVLLQTSMEYFILELGMSLQPFTVDYSAYAGLVTHSWLRSLWEKVHAFGLDIRIHNVPLELAKANDALLLPTLVDLGYKGTELERINRVRIHQQVLFVSDVLCAAGRYLDPQYLQMRDIDVQWSTYSRFPNEQPTTSDFKLWCGALRQLAPRGRVQHGMRDFTSRGHKLWKWRYCRESDRVLHLKSTDRMDVYARSQLPRHRGPNRYTRFLVDQPCEERGDICTVEPVAPAVIRVRSSSAPFHPTEPPSTFLEVLRDWGCTWLWDDLRLEGDTSWLAESLQRGSLTAVADGSYMRDLHPHLCSAAFIFECSQSGQRLVGSLAEHSISANAFRGELLGLLAIHLILLSINKLDPSLSGRLVVYSDCLGALGRVENLPPYRIPTRCKHSDILKIILVHCRDLSFCVRYEHIEAHQDDHTKWECLTRPAQLNTGCDLQAKNRLYEEDITSLPRQRPLPLEAITISVDGKKMTSDSGSYVRFAAQRSLARKFFYEYEILDPLAFDEVAWDVVHSALTEGVPRLFQQFACKQVMRISAVNKRMAHIDGRSNMCPCCTVAVESNAHLTLCEEAGRVEAFNRSVDSLSDWLEDNDTEGGLAKCLVTFLRLRGRDCMSTVCRGMHSRFRRLGESMDLIGWVRTLEGMIPKEAIRLQRDHLALQNKQGKLQAWGSGLVIRLLEITHGQWIYRNYVVHDHISGTLANANKEKLQLEIDRQRELGDDGLLEEDKYLAEVNLENLSTTAGTQQMYWLLAIQTARQRFRLTEERAHTTMQAGSQETGT